MTVLQSVLQLKVGNFVPFSALCVIHVVPCQNYHGEWREDLLKGKADLIHADGRTWKLAGSETITELAQLYFDWAVVWAAEQVPKMEDSNVCELVILFGLVVSSYPDLAVWDSWLGKPDALLTSHTRTRWCLSLCLDGAVTWMCLTQAEKQAQAACRYFVWGNTTDKGGCSA